LSSFEPRLVLGINKESLKNLKDCSMYDLGELIESRSRSYEQVSFSTLFGGISFPLPLWREKRVKIYLHKSKNRVEIFSLERGSILEIKLDNR